MICNDNEKKFYAPVNRPNKEPEIETTKKCLLFISHVLKLAM